MASIDSHNDQSARMADLTTKAWERLQLLAKRIPTLTDPKGEFIGDITSILNDILQVLESHVNIDSYQIEKQLTIIFAGGCFWTYLNEHSRLGRTFSSLRFRLYATGVRLNKPAVLYPRNLYADNEDTQVLDSQAEQMLSNLCNVLPTTNVVLYISEDEHSTLPPWVVDTLLEKHLADGEFPGLSGNYRWGVDRYLPVFTFLPKHTRNSQGQLPALKDMPKGARAAATGLEQPPNITSEVQQSSWNTKIALDSSHIGSDVMEIDWIFLDRMFPSTQDGQSSSSSQPPIIGTKRSPRKISQSRPSPVIQKLVPPEGTTAGGTEVTLLGSGFYRGLEIIFGDAEATTATFWGENCLTCTVPPALVPGFVTVSFKHEKSQDFQREQESQTHTCTYKYVDNHEVDRYRFTVQNSENHIQNSGFDKESASRQHVTAEVGATISTSSDSKMSPIMLANLAIMKYLAECLTTLDILSSRDNDIQKEVGRALLSLRYALEKGPLDDDTILSAILLWTIEKIRNDQHTAERHWEGIKVLIKLRPDFDIGVPLGRICFLALLILTNQERNSLTEASEVLRAAFRSAMENGVETDIDIQSVAATSAPTPAATVYSPWSETDAEPPPYMLSPTPLKQACLIYAAVNTHK